MILYVDIMYNKKTRHAALFTFPNKKYEHSPWNINLKNMPFRVVTKIDETQLPENQGQYTYFLIKLDALNEQKAVEEATMLFKQYINR